MQVTQVENGYIVKEGESSYIAKTLEEVMDRMLAHYEGRNADSDPGHFGAVIILRCQCYKTLIRGGVQNAACSNCTERLAVFA